MTTSGEFAMTLNATASECAAAAASGFAEDEDWFVVASFYVRNGRCVVQPSSTGSVQSDNLYAIGISGGWVASAAWYTSAV